MKYLRKFDSVSDMETAIASSEIDIIGLAYNGSTPVMRIKTGGTPEPDPTIPFYIDVHGTGRIGLDNSKLQMSTDGETWTNVLRDTPITGQTYFRVVSDQSYSQKPYITLNSDSYYDIGGNINSLVKTAFENDTTCYNFKEAFKGQIKLKSAANLILPATTLTSRCYESMFYGCTALTTAPALPATTLADHCYYNIFYGCTALTTAPALPATTLAEWCYDHMFQNCTSLVTAPSILPATTLATDCYVNMFQGCTALTTAPELPATKLVGKCYQYMFYGCTSLTTAPSILPATTLTINCYYCMFQNCTALTTAPELPATTLVNSCYETMFKGCTNLNYIKCLATDISAGRATDNWVSGVASRGTFVKNPSMSSWTTGTSGIPSYWTVEDDAQV